MIAYVTVGADDIARAKLFYSAFLPVLGYGLTEGPAGLSYTLPIPVGQPAASPDFYVGYLRDPQGNKIAIFSSDPAEPERDG